MIFRWVVSPSTTIAISWPQEAGTAGSTLSSYPPYPPYHHIHQYSVCGNSHPYVVPEKNYHLFQGDCLGPGNSNFGGRSKGSFFCWVLSKTNSEILVGWRICECRLLGSRKFTMGRREGWTDCQNCLKIISVMWTYSKSWIENCDSQGNHCRRKCILVFCNLCVAWRQQIYICVCDKVRTYSCARFWLGIRQMPK